MSGLDRRNLKHAGSRCFQERGDFGTPCNERCGYGLCRRTAEANLNELRRRPHAIDQCAKIVILGEQRQVPGKDAGMDDFIFGGEQSHLRHMPATWKCRLQQAAQTT